MLGEKILGWDENDDENDGGGGGVGNPLTDTLQKKRRRMGTEGIKSCSVLLYIEKKNKYNKKSKTLHS